MRLFCPTLCRTRPFSRTLLSPICKKYPFRSIATTTPGRKASPPDFAFVFDIDGVLLRAAKPLPGASESLSLLTKQNIPFLLLTNGGGQHEEERIAFLNDRLGLSMGVNQIIQSHTPFAELVKGTPKQEPLKDKTVLVVGGGKDKCREVARSYGFQSVVTPGDIIQHEPAIWPYSRAFDDYYKSITQPLPTQHDLKIDAIMVFNDPRDWGLDIQVIMDILLSSNGVMGTLSSKNDRNDLPNRGYLQDGQPPLYISNPDVLWAAQYRHPRIGQGAFSAALEGVWAAVTGGAILQKIVLGKPCQLTYEYAEQNLIAQCREKFENEGFSGLKSVYMVGDNPQSDIHGANSFKPAHGSKWNSILLRTGVYRGGEPSHKPTVIVDGVKDAVFWGLEQSKWTIS